MTLINGSSLPLLVGRRILVTGAGSGIGQAAVSTFMDLGARVFLADRNEEAVAAAAASSRAGGFCRGDVTSESDCVTMVKEASGALGGLDGLFHAAGVADKVATAFDLGIDEWQRIVDIDLRGTFLMARAAARLLVGQGHGAIVTIASVLGIDGIPRRDAYLPGQGRCHHAHPQPRL